MIEHRLIKINLPKILVRDYLTCVVLYHELGHFIDLELNVSAKLFQNKFSKPHILMFEKEEFRYYAHAGEYFADLFAAQYIEDSSSIYLSYVAHNNGASNTHPATSDRIEKVLQFINQDSDELIDGIQHVLQQSEVSQLALRYETIDPESSGFKQLIPHKITNVSQLHAIYKLGWETWMNSDDNFLAGFERRERYHIVNNLIEKSISNFNIQEIWTKNI